MSAGRALRVGIIGCGLIGTKRAEALGKDELVATFDLDPAAAARLAASHGGKACSTVEELLSLEPDIVVVATLHRDLPELACAALERGAHVLVEKPAGIAVADTERISAAAEKGGRLVKVGFNHRFHPGIARAITEARSGVHGPILYLRGRYGHGGRIGYDKEWRADPALSGGGEIVDQGMHLLDLSYWLHGALPLQSSLLRTQFWDAPVDDNAVLVLGEPGGVGSTAPFSLLHVSWTEWKNTFSLEIACRDAKLAVDGLVRSYGPQVLRIYRMRPELGPPDVEEVRYPDQDRSWEREWAHFTDAIGTGDARALLGDLASARYAWSIVEAAQGRSSTPSPAR
ncbi:MAG: Gfo/Idh/MocA family oxidoreductase [Acidimicrobiaceae bacterium]|nr:Gfo/Idh/MocA family oxidoreductase [Acidimicrobiaceae bacterium]